MAETYKLRNSQISDQDGVIATAQTTAHEPACRAMISRANAMPALLTALKFYARKEHWMGFSENDADRKLLVANGDTDDTSGWAVAVAAIAAAKEE